MTARKPTSDEQFEYDGPKTELDQLFDHHGYSIIDGPDPVDPDLDLEDDDG